MIFQRQLLAIPILSIPNPKDLSLSHVRPKVDNNNMDHHRPLIYPTLPKPASNTRL